MQFVHCFILFLLSLTALTVVMAQDLPPPQQPSQDQTTPPAQQPDQSPQQGTTTTPPTTDQSPQQQQQQQQQQPQGTTPPTTGGQSQGVRSKIATSGMALWAPAVLAMLIAIVGAIYALYAYKIPRFTLFLAGVAFTCNFLFSLTLTINAAAPGFLMVIWVVLSVGVGALFVYLNATVLFLGSLLVASVVASQLRYILSFVFMPPHWLFLTLLIISTPPSVFLGHRFPMLMLIVGSSLAGGALSGHSIDFQYQLFHLARNANSRDFGVDAWNKSVKRFVGILIWVFISCLGIWHQGKMVRKEKGKDNTADQNMGGGMPPYAKV